MTGRAPSTPGEPLAGLRCAVVGPGRVGRSMARWIVRAGGRIVLAVGRRAEPPADLPTDSRYVRLLEPMSGLGLAGPAGPIDLWLLTVPDAEIEPVARKLADLLAAEKRADSASALHAAGCLDAEALAPLRDAGLAAGSLHPLRAFVEVAHEPPPGQVFAVDGDAAALALARRLVAAWGGQAFEIAGDRRAAYHLAASLAAGGVTTVVAAVAELMRAADLPDALFDAYLELLRGAVDQLPQDPGDATRAITGPAARGDLPTLERHLRALRATAPGLEDFVRVLWRQTARQTRRDEVAAWTERAEP